MEVTTEKKHVSRSDPSDSSSGKKKKKKKHKHHHKHKKSETKDKKHKKKRKHKSDEESELDDVPTKKPHKVCGVLCRCLAVQGILLVDIIVSIKLIKCTNSIS